MRCACQRRAFLRDAGWAGFGFQKSTTCCTAAACTVAICFLAEAVAGPRALPTVRLAALSQILMNGFFLSQGLLTVFLTSDQWPQPKVRTGH